MVLLSTPQGQGLLFLTGRGQETEVRHWELLCADSRVPGGVNGLIEVLVIGTMLMRINNTWNLLVFHFLPMERE